MTRRGREASQAQGHSSGLDSMMESFRQLQAAYVQQKAAIVRTSIEAACSQEASMLAFSRTAAAHLKSALRSLVVVACAYDNETEELYCCFTSPPLPLLKAAEAAALATAAAAAPPRKEGDSPASSPNQLLADRHETSGLLDDTPATSWLAAAGGYSTNVGSPVAGADAIGLPGGVTTAPLPQAIGVAAAAVAAAEAATSDNGVAAAAEVPVGARRVQQVRGEQAGRGDRGRGMAETAEMPSSTEPESHVRGRPASKRGGKTEVYAAGVSAATGRGTAAAAAEDTRHTTSTAAPAPENSKGSDEQTVGGRGVESIEERTDIFGTAAAGGPLTGGATASAGGTGDPGAPLLAVAGVEEGGRRASGRNSWEKETGRGSIYACTGGGSYLAERAFFPAFPCGGGKRGRVRAEGGRGKCTRSPPDVCTGDVRDWMRMREETAENQCLAHQLLQFLRRRFLEDKGATDSIFFLHQSPSPSGHENVGAEVLSAAAATPAAAAAPPRLLAPAAPARAGGETAAATSLTEVAAAPAGFHGAGSVGGGDARGLRGNNVDAAPTAGRYRRVPDGGAAEQQTDAAGDEKFSRRHTWVFSLDSGCFGQFFCACREAQEEARACWYDPCEDRLLLSSSTSSSASAALSSAPHALWEEWLGEPGAPEHEGRGRLGSQQQQAHRRVVGRRASMFSMKTAAGDNSAEARDGFLPYIRVTRASLESNAVNRSSCFSQRTSWESLAEASQDSQTASVWNGAAAALVPPGVAETPAAACGESPPRPPISRTSVPGYHEGGGAAAAAPARGAAGGRTAATGMSVGCGLAGEAAGSVQGGGGASQQQQQQLLQTTANNRASFCCADGSLNGNRRNSSSSSGRSFSVINPRRSSQFLLSAQDASIIYNHVVDEGLAGRRRADASSLCFSERRYPYARRDECGVVSTAAAAPSALSAAGSRDLPKLEEKSIYKNEEPQVEAGSVGAGGSAPLRVLVRPLFDRSGSSRLWQRVKAGRIDYYASSHGWGRKLTATSLSSAHQGGSSSSNAPHSLLATGDDLGARTSLSKHSGEKNRPSWVLPSSRTAAIGPRPRDSCASIFSRSSSVSAAPAGGGTAPMHAAAAPAAGAPLRAVAAPQSRNSIAVPLGVTEEGDEASQSDDSRSRRSRRVLSAVEHCKGAAPFPQQPQQPPPRQQLQQQRRSRAHTEHHQQAVPDHQQVQLPPLPYQLEQQQQNLHYQGGEAVGELREEGSSSLQREAAGAGPSHSKVTRPARDDSNNEQKQTTDAAAGDRQTLSRYTFVGKPRDSVSSRRSSVSGGALREHSPRSSGFALGGSRRRSLVRRSRSVAGSSRSSSVRMQRPRGPGPRRHGDSLSSRETAAEEGLGPEQQQQRYPLGLLVCMEPDMPETEGLQLLDAIGAAVEPLLLNILEIEWLRRECVKKALQLELHRTVFQDSTNVMRKVERLLALVHTTISAEQVAFFIVDSQNSAFVCLGGALQARGLSLPFTHPLLGEALRQNGRIVIANDVPRGLNEAYDRLAHVNTRMVIVVPLMDDQGHVKALLLVVNRCVCAWSMLSRGSGRSLCTTLTATGSSPRPETGASGSGNTRSSQVPSSSSSDSDSTSSSLYEGNKERGAGGTGGGGGASQTAAVGGPLDGSGRHNSSNKGPAGGRSSFSCSCPACNIPERKRLIYGDLLRTASISNVLKVAHKFTREDEVLLRCVQREIQNALGGALTNMCMAGMTLLNPNKTMISYVIAEPDADIHLIRPGRSADKMLEEIESIVEEDKRLKFQSLRRCQSMAVALCERDASLLFNSSWRGRSVDCVRRRGISSSSEDGASLSSDSRPGSGEAGRELLSWKMSPAAATPAASAAPAAGNAARARAASAASGEVAGSSPDAAAQRNGDGETRRQGSPAGAAAGEAEPAGTEASHGAAAARTRGAPQGEGATAPAMHEEAAAARSRQPSSSLQQQLGLDGEEHSHRVAPQGTKSQAARASGASDSSTAFARVPLSALQRRYAEEAECDAVSSSSGSVRKASTGLGLRVSLEEEAEEREWMRSLTPGVDICAKREDEAAASSEENSTRGYGVEEGGGGRAASGESGEAKEVDKWRSTAVHHRGSRRRRGARRSLSLPTLIFSGALKKCEKHMRMLRKDMLLAQYRRWDLDIWKRTSGEMEVFFLLAFDDLGLLEWSEETRLRQFFGVIRDGYHTDNPYHNFYHAVHVFQVCWMFIASCGCRHVLSRLEQFSILLAALCHDVDHPGVNNAFLRAELHPLSIMYNDKAVLENHHAAFAVRTMMELNLYGAGEPRAYVSGHGGAVEAVAAMEPEQERKSDGAGRLVPSFTELRRLVIQAIFSTDMELFRHHHDAMKRRAQMKKSDREILQGEEDRALLVMCLIHCADICNPVAGGGRNVQWASLVTQEFNAQVDLERRKGMAISVFMDARTEVERIQSQIGFLSYVVLDQFRALAELLPEVEVLVQQGEKNLEAWQAALEAVTSAEEAKRKGLVCKEPVSNFRFRLKDLKFSGMQGPKCFGFIRSQVFDGYRPPSLDD